MDKKRHKLSIGTNDGQEAEVAALKQKLVHMEVELKMVIAELEEVKEERARDRINFEAEKCEWESKIDKYKEQCTELQSENEKLQNENEKLQSEKEKLQNENEKLQSEKEKLQNENEKLQSEKEELQSEKEKFRKYLKDFESANINVEEKNQITLTHNADSNSQITKVNKTNDDALDINAMPNEIILKVFSYLTQNQLGQIARVCRRWNVLTKSPVLWRNVNVKIFSSDREMNTVVAKSFINGLPSCVTFIRLNFSKSEVPIAVDFKELCVKLHQNCPHVEELILFHLEMSYPLPEVINLSTHFLQYVKKLVFHYCNFSKSFRTVELNDNSKIEVLDLYSCFLSDFNKKELSKLLYLKELRLAVTYVDDTWFVDAASFLNQLHVLELGWTCITTSTFLAIQRHGHNLKELYLCWFKLQDHDLTFTDSAFPRLKTICLSCYPITCESVVSLIQSCPSLENVFVCTDVAESFAAHPFVVANRCKSGIVKAIDVIHDHKLDYLKK